MSGAFRTYPMARSVGDIQGDYDASMQAGVEFIHAGYGFGAVNANVPEIAAFAELPEVVKSVL